MLPASGNVCVHSAERKRGRDRRDEEEEEEEEGCERGGGAQRGKPIIVLITGRLWIFYQASSAALPLCFCLFLSLPP